MRRRSFLKMSALGAIPLIQPAFASPAEKPMQNKVIVITGATSGIGEATARAFAANGATVFFCGRREKLGKAVETSIRRSGGDATYIPCDVRNEKQVDSFINTVVKKKKRIDVAFLNAGIAPAPAPIHECTTDVYTDLMNTHVSGTFFCARRVLPPMMKQKSGVIVITTSLGTRRVITGEALYATSKVALNGIIQHIANDYGKYNIRCLGIEPVGVRSEMLERRAKYLKVPIEAVGNPFTGRLIEPQEVAALVMSLATESNRLLNGISIDLSEGGSNTWIIRKTLDHENT